MLNAPFFLTSNWIHKYIIDINIIHQKLNGGVTFGIKFYRSLSPYFRRNIKENTKVFEVTIHDTHVITRKRKNSSDYFR